MADCFFANIGKEKSKLGLSDILGEKNYAHNCLYELLVQQRLSSHLFLFTRVRSSFSQLRDRILTENLHEVKTEVGGSVSIDEDSKIMGSVSNEGDLNFLFSNGGLRPNLILYAWLKRKYSSGLLEADLGCVSSYNDLMLKVVSSHQTNMEYSRSPCFKIKAKMEYDFIKNSFVTPSQSEFVHDLESTKECSEFLLRSKKTIQPIPAGEAPKSSVAGIMMNFRYELSHLTAAVLKVEKLALWYRTSFFSLWFQ